MEIGRRLGAYAIERLLGEGGMGAVYAARHERIGRLYAIKVLLPHLASRAEALGRFEREARALAALGHPNIVPIHDFAIEADGTAYLVMDLLTGTELARVLGRESPIEPARARRIAIDIAAGLAAAHRIGLVHRDLKPSNVFLVGEGERERAVLLDFGLAKALAPDLATDPMLGEKLTASGVILGTPHYMSPEQAHGSALDARADVWALGVVLYEMITGRLPFDGRTVASVFAAILTTEPAPPSACGCGGPAELEELVMRCLEKDRERRPLDASAVLASLGARGVAPADRDVANAITLLATPLAMPATRAAPTTSPAGTPEGPVASPSSASAPEPSAPSAHAAAVTSGPHAPTIPLERRRASTTWALGLAAVCLVGLGAWGAWSLSPGQPARPARPRDPDPSPSIVEESADATTVPDAATSAADAATAEVEEAPQLAEAPRSRPHPPSPRVASEATQSEPAAPSLAGRVPPGTETAPGARELLAAGERLTEGDFAGCLRELESAPPTLHILSVRMSCASNAHDRPALERTCSEMRERFPRAVYNQSCASLLGMPP